MTDSEHAAPKWPGNVPSMISQAAWIALAVAFVLLAFFASQHSRFPGDLSLSRQIQRIHAPLFELALDGPEALAGTVGATIAAVLIFAVLWGARKRRQASLVAAIPIGAALDLAIKHVVARPRPSPNLIIVRQHLSDPSFPSGHATAAALVFGLGWYVAGVLIAGRGLRFAAQAICVAAILCAGLARIYDGVHWLSDIYAGVMLGVLILRATLLVQRALPDVRPSSAFERTR